MIPKTTATNKKRVQDLYPSCAWLGFDSEGVAAGAETVGGVDVTPDLTST